MSDSIQIKTQYFAVFREPRGLGERLSEAVLLLDRRTLATIRLHQAAISPAGPSSICARSTNRGRSSRSVPRRGNITRFRAPTSGCRGSTGRSPVFSSADAASAVANSLADCGTKAGREPTRLLAEWVLRSKFDATPSNHD